MDDWLSCYKQIVLESFKFLELLDSTKFSKYPQRKCFPEEALNNLKQSAEYHDLFDDVKLKNELIVLYSSSVFSNGKLQLADILNLIHKLDIGDSFSEVEKLCTLALTFPSTTASVERSFSALKRIKTFLRNKMSQERLSNLSLIAVEKDIICGLKLKKQ